MTGLSCTDLVEAAERAHTPLRTRRGRVLITGTWTSPNNVEHAVVRGSCVTCGATHPSEEIR